MTLEYIELYEKLSDDRMKFIETMTESNPTITYQTASDTWAQLKITELFFELEKLKKDK